VKAADVTMGLVVRGDTEPATSALLLVTLAANGIAIPPDPTPRDAVRRAATIAGGASDLDAPARFRIAEYLRLQGEDEAAAAMAAMP
jgi:hypothetical protein